MNNLQKEIYETWKLWKEDKLNRNFYDTYVICCVGDYPEQADFYLTYWEGLKKYGNQVFCSKEFKLKK